MLGGITLHILTQTPDISPSLFGKKNFLSADGMTDTIGLATWSPQMVLVYIQQTWASFTLRNFRKLSKVTLVNLLQSMQWTR